MITCDIIYDVLALAINKCYQTKLFAEHLFNAATPLCEQWVFDIFNETHFDYVVS